VIARHWRGWTTQENAAPYESLLKETILPGLQKIEGYRGGYVLRREVNGEIEFIVLNFFDSLDAVRRFAGPDYATAVFEPEARRLLQRIEALADHFDICVEVGALGNKNWRIAANRS
jgi:heme-degrading monooxygenase HmoA